MLIFGGNKDSVYTFNTQENPGASSAVVKLLKNSSLRQKGEFCKDSEVFGRVF